MKILQIILLLMIYSCATGPTLQEIKEFETRREQFTARMYRETWARSYEVGNHVIDKNFFWRVESPQGKVSHLLGTMHAGIEFSEISPKVYKIFDQSKILVLESDPDRRGVELTSSEDVEDWTLDKEDLSKMLGEKAWKELCNGLKPFCGEHLKKLHPDIARILYLRSQGSKLIGGNSCLDCQIHDVARQIGKPRRYLEVAEELRPILFSKDHVWFDQEYVKRRDPKIAAKDLQTLLESDVFLRLKQDQEKYFDLAESYRSGDLNRIEKEFSREASKDFYRIFIQGRNETWIPRLEKILNEGDAFIAVGTGHMVGNASLVELLKKRGFKISRL